MLRDWCITYNNQHLQGQMILANQIVAMFFRRAHLQINYSMVLTMEGNYDRANIQGITLYEVFLARHTDALYWTSSLSEN